jgi:hypothetical protein
MTGFVSHWAFPNLVDISQGKVKYYKVYGGEE